MQCFNVLANDVDRTGKTIVRLGVNVLTHKPSAFRT